MARLLLENVTMRYPPLRRSLMREAAALFRERKAPAFALRGISLDLRDGDRLALLGPNGAGKTTLLSVMAGIYHPAEGRVAREGTMETLFSVAAGIDPQLDGDANIDLHLRRLGIAGKPAAAARAEIRAWSELEGALQAPVYTYSAGMRMRLAFSMAMASDPEILLIDEYFGAGDKAFQEKARAAMQAKMEGSRIVVFASHNPRLLESICNRALHLEKGEVVDEGPIDEVLPRYLAALRGGAQPGRRALMDEGHGGFAPDLEAPRPGRAATLQADPRSDEPSAACVALAGAGDSLFFDAMRILAEGAGRAWLDASEAFAAQGAGPAARIVRLKEDAPERGVVLGGLSGWPSFSSRLLEQGPVAVLVRDPREAAAEAWLIDSGLLEEGLQAALENMDGETASKFTDALAAVRGQYDALAASGAYSRSGVKLFRLEALLADPRSALAAIARHLGLAADGETLDRVAQALAETDLPPRPSSALRPAEQGKARAVLNLHARQLGYE